MRTVLRLLLVAVVLTPFVARAQATDSEQVQFDVFSLHAEVQGDVTNDLLSADLVAESDDRSSVSLANRINATMQWALTELKRYPAIKSATRNYSTWPRYERKTNRIVGWHATQTLHIESDDFDAARDAIQTLQERLLVRNMRLEPRPETRSVHEDQLIAAALDRFKERAVIVQENMGAADYRIVDVNITTNQRSAQGNPRYEQMARTSAVSEAPAIAGGTSTISVNVHGRIQLQ